MLLSLSNLSKKTICFFTLTLSIFCLLDTSSATATVAENENPPQMQMGGSNVHSFRYQSEIRGETQPEYIKYLISQGDKLIADKANINTQFIDTTHCYENGMERIDSLLKDSQTNNLLKTDTLTLNRDPLYQRYFTNYEGSNPTLYISKKRMSPPIFSYRGLPLQFPFSFLSLKTERNNLGNFVYFNEINSLKDTVKKFRRTGKRETIEGYECDAYQFSYRSTSGTPKEKERADFDKTIYVSKNFPFFPLGYDHFTNTGELTQSYRVEKIGKATGQEDAVMYYPAKATLTSYVLGIKSAIRQITIHDFELNIPLEEELFTIDPASVRVIFDEDTETAISVPTE